MAITLGTGGSVNSSGTTTTTVLTISTTSGRCVVVVFATSNTASTPVLSVTDSGGSVYTQRVAIEQSGASVEIWSTSETGSIASTSITATYALIGGRKSVLAQEYIGVVGIGTANSATSTSTSPSVSLTTQDVNNYVVAGTQINSGNIQTASVGTLRTAQQAGTGLSAALIDNTAASASSVTCTGTQATSAIWVAAAVELRNSQQSRNLIHNQAVRRASFF